MIVFFIFLIIIAALAVLTDAYPVFAGTCAGGNPISLSPHPDGGPLGNGNLTFKLNGNEVPASAVIDLTTGIHQLELYGDLFNGFLFRLSSPSGVNTKNKLIYSDDDARDQGSCDSNVAGITHFNAEPKSSITMTFDGSDAGNYTLDLTAGIGRELSPPSGKWLYNQYNFKVSPPSTPLPSQSSGPSVHPSPEPSTTPSLSSNPSSPLILEPSDAPNFSFEPSMEPTDTPNSPTLSSNPSSPLILEPSDAPNFSFEPSMEPSDTPNSPTLSSNPSSPLILEPSDVPNFSFEPSMEPTDTPNSPTETSSAPFKGVVLSFMASLLLTAPLLTV